METLLPEIYECPFCRQGKLVERKVTTRTGRCRFYARVQCGCRRDEHPEMWPFWVPSEHAEYAIDQWNKHTRDYFEEVVTKQINRGGRTTL